MEETNIQTPPLEKKVSLCSLKLVERMLALFFLKQETWWCTNMLSYFLKQSNETDIILYVFDTWIQGFVLNVRGGFKVRKARTVIWFCG